MREFAKIHWKGETYSFKQGENSDFIATDFEKRKKLELSISENEITLNEIVPVRKKQDVFKDEKSYYLTAANKLIHEIESKNFDKVVLSKRKTMHGILDLDKSFENLIAAHPKACVFCYCDGEELWMGATPETLLEKKDNRYATMALAGSKPFDDEKDWSQKELIEHNAVVLDIMSKLADFNPTTSETLTSGAGAVKHLRTEISFNTLTNPNPLLEKLHPTTAVCGKPQKEAFNLIAALESTPRSFYTGYFGIQLPELTHFWVNLRSFQVFDDCVCLYLGGGFVEGSIAEKEWDETEWKAQSLVPHLRFL